MTFIAFIAGMILGGILGVLLMCILIGAKKTGGGQYLPDDD